ncbi:hypothetical protein RHOSPDRAFT_32167 [Rhodotorula sp. JG-1b]|nr:hypothetical protein RHOSPDRAFT_32167 [Rhodotorula sp. JG-1b]
MTTPDTDLLERWTAEQLRQASLAVFHDDSSALLSVERPGASPVIAADLKTRAELHHEQFEAINFDSLRIVAGCDISFRDAAGQEGVAVLSVLSFPELQVLTTISRVVDLSETPYIHSYLSFREADIYASLVDELRSRREHELVPEVLYVDGNGRWHPRQAGSAVAVGVKTGLPTIGVAKEFHPLHTAETRSSDIPSAAPSSSDSLRLPDGYLASQKCMRRASQAVLRNQGDWLALPAPVAPHHPSNPGEQPRVEHWGAALLSSPVHGALNPIFVSPGHRLSLETSVRVTLACTRNGKVPEPVRCADLFGRQEVKRIWSL